MNRSGDSTIDDCLFPLGNPKVMCFATLSSASRSVVLPLAMVASITLACTGESHAQGFAGNAFGFQAFGFYQPYGIQYRSTVATPPYFAVNPPVYYGKRYYRPYGVSPFAAPPQVAAPASYQALPEPANLRLRHIGPVGQPVANPHCPTTLCESEPDASNPDVPRHELEVTEVATAGPVRSNPFFDSPRHLVSR
ncbi:MAG: hypothetical protein AAGD07_05340 [Planctomycetota bacterium]